MRPGLLLLLLTLSACLAPRTLPRHDELTRIAWYVEDLAHGLPRAPGELRDDQASIAMQNVAAWAAGTTRDGVTIAHPARLQARRDRWQLLLRGAMAAGWIQVDRDGLLRLPPDLPPDVIALLRGGVQAENFDRVELAAILLSRGHISRASPTGQALLDELLRARIHHDTAAGALPWQSTARSTSPSPSAPTTSPSAPVSSPVPGD